MLTEKGSQKGAASIDDFFHVNHVNNVNTFKQRNFGSGNYHDNYQNYRDNYQNLCIIIIF